VTEDEQGCAAAEARGYPKDEAQAEIWRRRLDAPGVMTY